MGSCYSGDHVAGDHIHMDITMCDIEEPPQGVVAIKKQYSYKLQNCQSSCN